MPQASFATKIGATTDLADEVFDIIAASEPEVGATLRTKGRLYFLCEVLPPGRSGRDIAREVADLARQEYYYDLSAGIEVSLRRSLRSANRRAAQRLREQRGRTTLHCVCAVLVGSEVYAARIGAAQIFLVRHARLFLPGDEPGELADFVHRTTAREAASLGADVDVLPAVWRQTIEAGDTLILAGSSVVAGLGAEALKNAAVTLHPRAAAEHVRNRFVADGVAGSAATLFVEIGTMPSLTQRVAAPPSDAVEPEEVRAAEAIRSGLDRLWRRRPRLGSTVRAAAAPATTAVAKGVAIGLELMPRRRATLPRPPDLAERRSAREQRALGLLAAALLLVTMGIGGVAIRDHQANQVWTDYRAGVLRAEEDIASARRLVDAAGPDRERARERLAAAGEGLAAASRSPVADPAEIAKLRAEIALLRDQLNDIRIDLARLAPLSRPAQLAGTVRGLYAADPGAGRLWRIFGEPVSAGVVLEKGRRGVGTPLAVVAQGEALLAIDDGGRVWRAEGDSVADVTPPDPDKWRSVGAIATYSGNLYVLDRQGGQVWRHAAERGRFAAGSGLLASPLPPNAARSLAVDGDVWIVTTPGEILRYGRSGVAATVGRIDFTVRWEREPVRPTAIQALDSQGFLYLLDAPGRRVVQLTRDGREIARFALPAALEEPAAFFVDEGARLAYTAHGSKIAVTDLSR